MLGQRFSIYKLPTHSEGCWISVLTANLWYGNKTTA